MKKHLFVSVGLITLLALVARAGQDELAGSVRETREEATATGQQLKTTLTALNAVVGQTEGDLRPAFEAFRAEIPKTQAAESTTAARVEKMTREKEKYFGDWQSTINGISNMSLHKKAQKRLRKASESYDRVREALITAGEKFRPFLSDLADVEKTLNQDVTAAGVKSVKGVVKSANWDYNSVSKSINKALAELQKMEKALSSSAQ